MRNSNFMQVCLPSDNSMCVLESVCQKKQKEQQLIYKTAFTTINLQSKAFRSVKHM